MLAGFMHWAPDTWNWGITGLYSMPEIAPICLNLNGFSGLDLSTRINAWISRSFRLKQLLVLLIQQLLLLVLMSQWCDLVLTILRIEIMRTYDLVFYASRLWPEGRHNNGDNTHSSLFLPLLKCWQNVDLFLECGRIISAVTMSSGEGQSSVTLYIL